MPTFEQTQSFIKSKIHGFRKGTTDKPSYLHSFRVYELLKKHGFDEDIQMGWLLHDIIEDSWKDKNWKEVKKVTFEDIKKRGYNDPVLRLLDFSTLDTLDGTSYEKRERMLERIIQEENKNLRAIKLADISDNLTECHLMPDREKLNVFLNKKCPVFVYYGNKYFGGTEFYNEFIERYFNQMKKYNQYFIRLSEYPDFLLAVTDETKIFDKNCSLKDWYDIHLINLSGKKVEITYRPTWRANGDEVEYCFAIAPETPKEEILNDKESIIIEWDDLERVLVIDPNYDSGGGMDAYIARDKDRYYLRLNDFFRKVWNKTKTLKWKKNPWLKEKAILFSLDGNLLS